MTEGYGNKSGMVINQYCPAQTPVVILHQNSIYEESDTTGDAAVMRTADSVVRK